MWIPSFYSNSVSLFYFFFYFQIRTLFHTALFTNNSRLSINTSTFCTFVIFFLKVMSRCVVCFCEFVDNPRFVRNMQVLEKVKRSQPVEFSFIKSFEGKCRKYAGPTAYRDLEQSVNNLKLCVQEQLKSENACARLPTEVRNCTRSVINKLRICLPPQESYLPNFAHGSIDAVLHYICDNNGKNFKRLTYSSGLTCLLSNDPKSLNDCLSGTKTTRTKDNDIVTKAELCEDLDKVQLCLSTYITNHCRDMSDFKQVTIGIMESFKAPCSSCNNSVNQFILIASILLTITKIYS